MLASSLKSIPPERRGWWWTIRCTGSLVWPASVADRSTRTRCGPPTDGRPKQQQCERNQRPLVRGGKDRHLNLPGQPPRRSGGGEEPIVRPSSPKRFQRHRVRENVVRLTPSSRAISVSTTQGHHDVIDFRYEARSAGLEIQIRAARGLLNPAVVGSSLTGRSSHCSSSRYTFGA